PNESLHWTQQQNPRGGYGGAPVPGALLDYGPTLREPFGRIHWAGAETSPAWTGYMEGAIRSGERAAKEVLTRLEEA
ncbi:MAG: FAD-dependent oxidoreductase, partial [Rubrobacteraceae bacterium]